MEILIPVRHAISSRALRALARHRRVRSLRCAGAGRHECGRGPIGARLAVGTHDDARSEPRSQSGIRRLTFEQDAALFELLASPRGLLLVDAQSLAPRGEVPVVSVMARRPMKRKLPNEPGTGK